MSHAAVTVRTTTTTSTSAILVNTGYMKTPPGFLKVLQVIVGIVCVGLTANYFTKGYNYDRSGFYYYSVWSQELFFLLMATTFLIATFLLLVSCVASITTATLLPKTLFEVVYHVTATILLLVSAGLYISQVADSRNRLYYYEGRFAASVLGLFNAVLYAIAIFFSCRYYRNMG